ncbi:MAG: hypothetical protein IH934_07995 [Nanoarchaeota archaeon]|nr:hypothetical protein [Nanoarchaeota archaeon]
MEAKEVNITYETLYELLKREKDMTDLQKLDPSFFNHFVDYLNDKKKILGKEDSLFSYEEKKKVEKQIDNAKRIIKEIYERREKKILNIALIKSRTKSDVLDTSSMLENENFFFDEIVKTLNVFRKDIIENIIDGKQVSEVIVGKKEANKTSDEISEKKEMEKNTKLVRFLYSVPKFVGKELEEYGPFEEEDIANLPAEIAEILINKGRVEEIKGN